ncbi:hypothetical protein ATKI12_4314 [Kitasatospora sp. Ki12]
MTFNSDAFDTLQAWAVQKLSGVPFADGVPLLALDDALARIARELPRLGGPQLASPSVDLLAVAVTNTATRIRRSGLDDSRALLLGILADELRDADEALDRGDHRGAVDRVRRVCAMAVCLDELTGHAARGHEPMPTGRRGLPEANPREGLRALPSIAVSSSPTATPSDAAGDVPWNGPSLGDVVLGEHLRHLRECRGFTRTDVADRLPGEAHADAHDLAELEAGTSQVLYEAARQGQLTAYLEAYGAGAVAAADVRRVLAAAQAARPGYFPDQGPGWPHHYRILEARADTVVLVGAVTIPAALRTAQYEMAMSLEAPTIRVPGGVPEPPMSTVPGDGCQACSIYRSDLLAKPGVAGTWQRALNGARAEAFDARLRRLGTPEATLLLSADLLTCHGTSPRVHAAQMVHLATLARTTALRVCVLPPDRGVVLGWDAAELRVGERTLTVAWSVFDVTYQEGSRLRMSLALDAALPPEPSITLLERATAGDLPRRRRW